MRWNPLFKQAEYLTVVTIVPLEQEKTVSNVGDSSLRLLTHMDLWGSLGSYTTRGPLRPSQYWVAFRYIRVELQVVAMGLTVMRMVPKCSRLIWDIELIQKGISRSDRTLGDTNRTVCPVAPFLKNAMPMLMDQSHDLTSAWTAGWDTYNAGARHHRCLC